MNEKRLRKLVIGHLVPLCAFAVENDADDGTPDVCTTIGWIELKTGTFPARSSTRVMVKVRNAQRIWMRRWTRFGGKSWTITVIDGEWFLHKGAWSCDHLGIANEEDFREAAIASWPKTPAQNQLIKALLGKET